MESIKQTNLIGYKNLFLNLVHNFEQNNLPNKILLSGKQGIGKSIFCYHLVNYILSKNENFSYNLEKNTINRDNNSYKLILNSSHPNFFSISLKPEKKNIEISQIKEMINFTNKSSFYNKSKIILIDNVEKLNSSSSNALLKTLEEPNNDVLFLMVYNNHFSLFETIKSRCIEFKLNLSKTDCSKIINNLLGDNIFDNFAPDFKNLNLSPLFYIELFNFCNENNIDYSNLLIEDLLKFIISKKLYMKNSYIKNNIKLFIEIYFKKNFFLKKSLFLYKNYNYFNIKYNSVMNFNLDFETFMIEFNSVMLNE